MSGRALRLSLLASFILAACDFETTDGDVDRGIARLAEDDATAAVAAFEAAAASLPESPALNYGRGVAQLAAGNQARAIELLLRALEARDPALRQRVFAALGAAHVKEALRLEAEAPAAAPEGPPGAEPAPAGPSEAAMKAWKQAVDFLEDALVLKPDDAAARQNLEVALLRVDPPCAARDDTHEENDSAGTARLLTLSGAAEGEPGAEAADPAAGAEAQPAKVTKLEDRMRFQAQLFACPDDDDWYKVDANPGDRFVFRLTVPEGGGRLVLRVHDAANRLLGEGLELRHTVPADAAPGPLFVSVTNPDLEEVSYGLGIEVRPACSSVEDVLEDNDALAAARTLTPGSLPDLKLCPGDDDWYAVELGEGESVFVYAEPEPPPKDEASATPPASAAAGASPAVAGTASGLGAVAAAPAPAEGAPFELDAFRVPTSSASATPGAEPAPTPEPLARGGQSGRARVATLLTPGPGRYVFRVHGRGDWEGRYALQVEIVPPCPEGDDRFEDNDLSEDATDFEAASAPEAPADGGAQDPAAAMSAAAAQQGPKVVFARVCPGDVDWWQLSDDPAEKAPAVVGLTFDHAQGDLAMSLWDEKGVTELARSDASSPAQSAEALPLPRPAPPPKGAAGQPASPAPGASASDAPAERRSFRLKVEANGGGQNFYLLRLDRPQGGGGDGDGEPEKDGDSEQDKQDPKDDVGKDDPKDSDKSQAQPDGKDGEKPQDPQAAPTPLEDLLDKLDRNPDNLEARDSARKTPLTGQRPRKDW
jgi:hypothetical protein